MSEIKYNQFPFVEVKGDFPVFQGWKSIGTQLLTHLSMITERKKVVTVEYYQGVLEEAVTDALVKQLQPVLLINTKCLMWHEDKIKKMTFQDVTNDRIFGYITRLNIDSYFDPEKVDMAKRYIESYPDGLVLIVGAGAAFIYPEHDLLVYADMARWETQLRMRRHEVDNLGVYNRCVEDWMLLYKQGFFVDWRVLDRWKKKLMKRWDYVLDTNNRHEPKLVAGEGVIAGLNQAVNRPFSVVPFFDPGPWGGQWMKKYCHLDPEVNNYAWCFNCVPEENSLLLKFGDAVVEIPSINLVFHQPRKLLGDSVHARFGDEFPIRFDFLDTIEGGNLSLQVHPLTEYIQEKFGMHYTQDESYYMMHAVPGAKVYLGLKDGVDPEAMICDLETAQAGGAPFEAEKHVGVWPVNTHDHFLIPAGTVHCSGAGSMVLEISATPYIFTFKMWDWGRFGIDGKPRPINIEHGKNVIQWDRTEIWTRKHLINQIETIAEGDGWKEERTGLHEREFIETRRHWFSKKVTVKANDSVHVICLVEGGEILVESPVNAFEPFEVHYAETFIVPAAAGDYTMKPFGDGTGKQCATMLAFVRKNA
ncbi:MAG: class I mannose-6-phosphate isomerase [Paludibacter sp.]|nr:class I mannose-6-phosphate isomerase [Paludibacter sp.]